MNFRLLTYPFMFYLGVGLSNLSTIWRLSSCVVASLIFWLVGDFELYDNEK